MKRLKSLLSIVMALTMLTSTLVLATTPANAEAVAYSQYDSRWSGWVYGGGTIGGTGCGILSTVNALNYLVGIDDIGGAIDEIATWAHDIGAYNYGNGDDGTRRLELYPYIEAQFGSKYGFRVDEGSVWGNIYNETLRNHLANGGVAIAHVNYGHFICLAAFDSSDNTFLVLDSAPGDSGNTGNGVAWLPASQLNSSGNSRMHVDWFCLFSSTGTSNEAAPYIGDDGDLYFADCNSLTGWRTAYNTELHLEAAVNPVGNYVVLDPQRPQADNDPNVGAMAFYEYSDGNSADASDFNYLFFELYSSIDYKNAGRNQDYFQVNFFTDGEDGYNTVVPASEISSGWQNIVMRKSTITRAVGSADWRNITGVRFTWFNNSHGDYVEFAVDTVKAYKGDVTPYLQDQALMLTDCNDTVGWRAEWGASLGQSPETNPDGYCIDMFNENFNGEAQRLHSVGGMLFFDSDVGMNLSNYNTISLEVWSSIDYASSGRSDDFLELIFASTNSDESGFKYDIPVSQIHSGWQVINIPLTSFTQNNSNADWSNIRRIRFTWFNFSGGDRVDFAFDTVKAIQ